MFYTRKNTAIMRVSAFRKRLINTKKEKESVMMDKKEKVINFLKRFIGDYDLKDDDNIFELKLVNSLFAMQLVTYIEQEFCIVLEADDFEMSNFKDVNSILKLIECKQG